MGSAAECSVIITVITTAVSVIPQTLSLSSDIRYLLDVRDIYLSQLLMPCLSLNVFWPSWEASAVHLFSVTALTKDHKVCGLNN